MHRCGYFLVHGFICEILGRRQATKPQRWQHWTKCACASARISAKDCGRRSIRTQEDGANSIPPSYEGDLVGCTGNNSHFRVFNWMWGGHPPHVRKKVATNAIFQYASAAVFVVGHEMPLEHGPQVMSCHCSGCSGVLAPRSTGAQSNPTKCPLNAGPRSCRAPAAECLRHVSLAFLPILVCSDCYSRCLHKGCSRSTGPRSDPECRLVMVEYEMPLEARPHVMSCRCSSALAPRFRFSSYYGVFRLLCLMLA